VTRLAPEIAAWLASHGVTRPSHVRTMESATLATMLVVDDRVLRWYGDSRFLEEEPDAVVREAAALTALAGTEVPAPRLVAWSQDPPAILSTFVPGEPRTDLPDPEAIRDVLELIHAVDPGPVTAWTYRGYHEGVDLVRPIWWKDAATWERAVVQTGTARPTAALVFIHRDFHPGNILWADGRIRGVVDWVNACLGPAAFDLAHMRVNLAVLRGVDGADVVGDGDPAWDIEAAFGFLDWSSPAALEAWPGPWPHLAAAVARNRLEAFVGRSLARLG
jgi:aminoglycoside phosphotransferase (APT) family kinase protein